MKYLIYAPCQYFAIFTLLVISVFNNLLFVCFLRGGVGHPVQSGLNEQIDNNYILLKMTKTPCITFFTKYSIPHGINCFFNTWKKRNLESNNTPRWKRIKINLSTSFFIFNSNELRSIKTYKANSEHCTSSFS